MSKKLFFLVAGIGLAGLFSGCGEDNAVSSQPLTCTPGTEKCENGKFRLCLGTTWQYINCPSGECNDDGITCKLQKSCLPGIQRCMDYSPESIATCVEDGTGWYLNTCPGKQICDMKTGEVQCLSKSNINPAECIKDDVKCSLDGKKKQICGEDQRWGDEIACGEGKECFNSKKDCVDL